MILQSHCRFAHSSIGAVLSVSVIIAAYNAEAFLAAAIQSCLSQTHPPLEIIVVDDGSTDGTSRIAVSYGSQVRLIRLPKNVGVASSRNIGIAAAKGDWISFLDADDWYLPRKLELQLAAAKTEPSLAMIYGDFIERTIDGTDLNVTACEPNRLREFIQYRCAITICTVLVRRETILLLGGFDPALKVIEDWDLWLRVLHRLQPQEIGCVHEPLAVYRRTEGSLTSKTRDMLNSRLLIANRVEAADQGSFKERLLRRRVRSFIYYDAAIALRHDAAPDYLETMLRSLREWPLPCLVMGRVRYKIALVMLLQRYFGWKLEPHRTQASRRS
ncbi:Glycosyltransferase involved in cell wall bisynthesis [Bryocella elongata]|uniref:Glycosyltransferase involved in cell wall bisynthesis n=1 Tax=Bryocella elongata TaxID=863522 RepID=A0A1H5ZM47_9BACT|nr:glycosyltransferase [Bryocella elongata]SEG37281.1 Glycosyltransferase involved in cell wall bisynthesis [Bryocella elongata]